MKAEQYIVQHWQLFLVYGEQQDLMPQQALRLLLYFLCFDQPQNVRARLYSPIELLCLLIHL